MFNLSTLENMLDDYKSKALEEKNNIIHVQYDKYVSEHLEAIIETIHNNNKILIDAPTGGGKTHAIVEVMKSFKKEELNIILTPNVIQNKQNAQKYKIQAFTGNDKAIYSNCISATFDKARALIDYIKGKNLRVNLFIDECHLLVEASNYRMRAIRDIIELSTLSTKIVYMSATNEYSRKILDHEVELDIRPKEKINNISTSQLLLLDNKNVEGSLVHQLLGYSKINERKTILFLDSIEQLKVIKNILISKGFKDNEIALISSKEKTSHDEKVFDDIINISEIPQETKIILSTSVLEVGTNIDTGNMNIFLYIPKSNHLNINKMIQEVARFRVARGQQSDNILKICLPRRVKEDNTIKSFNSIKRDLESQANNNINGIMYLLSNQYKDENTEIKNLFITKFLSAPKSLYNVSDTYSMGILELDKENSIVTINPFKLQRKAKEIYESQFFYNIEELEEKLKNSLNVDIWLDTVTIQSDNFKEEFQEVNEVKKDLKEKKQDFIKDTFNKIKELELQDIFIDKVSDPNLNTEISIIENNFNELENTNIIKLANTGVKMCLSSTDIILSFIANGDSMTKNKRQFLSYEYRNWNRALPIGSEITLKKVPYKEYVYCRLILDDTCSKQGRITQSKKLALLIQLIENNVIKGYEIKKGSVYQHKKNDFGSKPKPLDKNKIDKLLTPIITAVYKLCDNNKMISSLKTQ